MEHSIIREPKIVVALDIGSVYCGYAWQFRSDFKENKGNIVVNDDWASGAVRFHKTTSCVLLEYTGTQERPNLEAARRLDYNVIASQYTTYAFGQQAERIYQTKLEDCPEELPGKWFFFKRFKHLLYYDENLRDDRSNINAEDQQAQQIPIVVVMSKLIGALKDHFIKKMIEKNHNIHMNEILFILTVPAIWTPRAKKLMRDAAELSGIRPRNIILANEPEAAVVYCMFLPEEQRENMGNVGIPGQTFLVADLGGLTTDLCVVRVDDNCSLEELMCAKGRLCGGGKINEEFFIMLRESFQNDGWTRVVANTDCASELIELENEFETKKVLIGCEDVKDEKIKLNVPRVLTTALATGTLKFNENGSRRFEYDNRYGRFYLRSEYIRKELFEKTTLEIFNTIDNALTSYEARDCCMVILVGGFSESPMVRKQLEAKIRAKYAQMKVVSPLAPFLAVLKGAVLFGHNPLIFKSRISRATFGVSTNVEFDPKIHDEEKKWIKWIDKQTPQFRCKDVFDVHVRRGQSVLLNHKQPQHTYTPVSGIQRKMRIKIYATEQKDPKYVTDKGCLHICTVAIDIPDKAINPTVEVTMIYGGTELSVLAMNTTTRELYDAHISFADITD